MTQVSHLCKKGILLDNGSMIFKGDMQHAISSYLNSNIRNNHIDIDSLPRTGIKVGDMRIKTLKLVGISNDLEISEGDSITLEIWFDVYDPIDELVIGFSLTDFYGNNVVECRSTSSISKMKVMRGSHKASVSFTPALAAGAYNLNLGARSEKGHLEYIPSVVTMDILPSKNAFEEWNKPSVGIVMVESQWNFETF
jgi:hypothetical protein